MVALVVTLMIANESKNIEMKDVRNYFIIIDIDYKVFVFVC